MCSAIAVEGAPAYSGEGLGVVIAQSIALTAHHRTRPFFLVIAHAIRAVSLAKLSLLLYG